MVIFGPLFVRPLHEGWTSSLEKKEGEAFIHWTDSDGNDMGKIPLMSLVDLHNEAGRLGGGPTEEENIIINTLAGDIEQAEEEIRRGSLGRSRRL